MAALEDGEDHAEEEPENQLHQSDSQKPPPLSPAEPLSHAETGSEAPPEEEEEDSGAARAQNEDVYPTSASSDRETTQSLTDTKSARLDLREEETQSSEERLQIKTTGETSAIIKDTTPKPQTAGRLKKRVTLVDPEASLMAEGGTQNPSNPMVEGKPDKEEPGQNSRLMNGKADNKKNSTQQRSKFKTVSYRRIRRGNTRQRIDEFEAMMDS
ncbi:hypothetical protein PBY51_016590 [Eleginops maclovinus]|uniref:Ermin n=2 Tax=Eleginops maclovinus TaxID=56733 RepID=A0AAN7ZTP9_ELEMC|nr:hypothetical protein PBY51_016590 [Eleginops maclovinus]